MATSIIPKQHPAIIPVNELEMVQFVKNTAANETMTLTFSGGVRALMFFFSSTAARNGAYMLVGSTSNTQAAPLVAGSGITITPGTGKITVNTAYSVGCFILWLNGADNLTIS